MKSALFFFSLTVLFAANAAGQAYEDKIQYDKDKQAAIAIDYTFPIEAVENAFIERMKKLGYKAKEEKGFLNRDKGFIVFKNAYVSEISRDNLDYIIKVERKSKKESDVAVLYLFMLKKEENVVNTMSNADLAKTKRFLNNLLPDVEAAHLELQIKDQETSLDNAEKKLRTLQAERQELDTRLAENLKTQDETAKEIESRKLSLETLRGKRKKE